MTFTIISTYKRPKSVRRVIISRLELVPSMKSITAFIFFAVLISAEALATTVLQHFEKCKAETGVSGEFAKKVFLRELDFDDHAGKCLIKCLCQKVGSCDENGVISEFPIADQKIFEPEKVSVFESISLSLSESLFSASSSAGVV